MTIEPEAALRVSLLTDAGRRDVVVPSNGLVADLARSVESHGVSTLAGRELEPEAALADVIHSGDILILDPRPPAAQRRAAGPVQTDPAALAVTPSAAGHWPWMAALLLAAAHVPWFASVLTGEATAGWRPLILVGSAAVLAALAPPMRSSDPVTVCCWLLAGLGGLASVAVDGPVGWTWGITVALLAAATVVAVRVVSLRGTEQRQLAGVLLTASVVLAAIGALATASGTAFPVAVVVGLVPLAFRAAPAWSVSMPDAVLLDTSSQQVATAIRAREEVSPTSVQQSSVEHLLGAAHLRSQWIAVVVALIGVVAVTATISGGGTPLQRWAILALLALSALSAALIPRNRRGHLTRIAPRGYAAATALATAGWLVHQGVAPGWLIGACFAAAAIATAVAVAINRGWRSVWWSRLADFAESAGVVLSPAIALVAAGAIAAMTQLASR
ncbi:MAG: hypothetical protein ACK5KU_03935 [Beutenbergiaceae bacterium]